MPTGIKKSTLRLYVIDCIWKGNYEVFTYLFFILPQNQTKLMGIPCLERLIRHDFLAECWALNELNNIQTGKGI